MYKRKNEMNKKHLIASVVMFIVLTVTGISLIVYGPSSTQANAQQVLPMVGAAIFGGGLAFFLVEMFNLDQQKR
jgi:hypothetical protein